MDHWYDAIINDIDQINECIESLEEGRKYASLRGGKYKLRIKCPGRMKSADGGKKCVPMQSSEKMKKRAGAIRSKGKRKAKHTIMLRKRKRTAKKRKARGLK
jgi:hypothetical protein